MWESDLDGRDCPDCKGNGKADIPICAAMRNNEVIMQTPKPLLKNLGAKLRQMMAEDWRGEDERNTLGMAGHWLEKLAEDSPQNVTPPSVVQSPANTKHQ